MELKNKRLVDLSTLELQSLVGSTIKIQKVCMERPYYELITEDLSKWTDKIKIVEEKIAKIVVSTDADDATIALRIDVVYSDGILIDRDDKILYPSIEKTPEQLGFKFS